jgi:carbon starvation protein
VNSALTGGFLFVVLTILFYSVTACRKALANPQPTAQEIPSEAALDTQPEAVRV